jgi:predicted metal-dependent HD superfamily phosphohydrolase
MPITILKRTWQELIFPYSKDEKLINDAFDELVARYSAVGRYYHNLSHLQALLALQQQFAGLARNKEIMQLAIFYHDIIYNVKQTDNEEQSALAAGRFLQQTGFPAYQLITVMDYIRATKSHTGDEHDEDLQLFLDFDLAILGSEVGNYRQYARQVRQEYSIYPDEVYNPGRKKVLAHFLELPSIYKTGAFREQYEAQARKNISMEMAEL